MAGLGNNLYPPIFKKAYVPAFIRNNATDKEQCKIYFSLSVYNSLSELARYESTNSVADFVQVSIQHQNSNYSALNLERYRTGIMFTDMKYDPTRTSDDKYYITIEPDDLERDEDLKGGFKPGEYYKLQIRFTGRNITSRPETKYITEAWINENLSNFSEWSQVVILKSIEQPILELRGFTQDSEERTFSLKQIDLIGKVKFNEQDDEYLKKYRILLYDNEGVLLEDSKDIYSNVYTNPNEINYQIKYDLENLQDYKLKIQLETNNLYTWSQEYPFSLSLIEYTTLDPGNFSINATPDNQAGWIQIKITSQKTISQLSTNFIIRRSSSKDGFKTWEDVHLFLAKTGEKVNEIWEDRIIQSGVWYKYGLQQRNLEGFRSNMLEKQDPVICIFDNIFLLNEDRQLKIKFNPQVNNYSHVVSQSLTQTIGSQYPFIRRNGNVNYRTFSLSGTISAFMDIRENGMKASFEDLYNNGWQGAEKYRDYNQKNNINYYNNSIYEKDFREQVIRFLYDNSVKLYKSTTEGNILVKLMNISFTPNNTLSRHIYDFTCTIQEIDTFNIQNCSKYNIQIVGQFINETEVKLISQGQVMVPDLKLYYPNDNFKSVTINNRTGQDGSEMYHVRQLSLSGKNLCFTGGEISNNDNKEIIKNYILPKYQRLATDTIDIRIDYLSSLRIEFTSNPYAVTLEKDGKFKMCSSSNEPQKQEFIGHVIRINNDEILVGPEGIYELSDKGTQIFNLSFLSPNETGILFYEAVIVEFERSNQHPKEYENVYKVGQLIGAFNTKDSLFKKVYLRYYYQPTANEINQGGTSQVLQQIKGIRIFAKPNTSLLIRDAQDNYLKTNGYDTFFVGDTGLLEFYDEKTDIKGIYVTGVHLKQNLNPNKVCKDNEYFLEEGEYSSIEEIENPQKNHVYGISSTEALTVLRNRLYSVDDYYKRGVILEQNTQIIDQDAETALINKNLLQTMYCIYYGGGWYLFSLDSQIVLGYPTEIIMDYYCQILRKRY